MAVNFWETNSSYKLKFRNFSDPDFFLIPLIQVELADISMFLKQEFPLFK